MLRHALSELRLHPTRFVATLIAIAISVGFVAAISVFVNSQQTALGMQNALQLSKADVVVRTESVWTDDETDPLGGFADAIAAAVSDIGGAIIGMTGDVSKEADCVAMIDRAAAEFGRVGQRPEEENHRRRDAKGDHVGKRIELGTEFRGHAQVPGKPPVKPIQHGRDQDGVNRHVDAPLKAHADRGEPGTERQQRH